MRTQEKCVQNNMIKKTEAEQFEEFLTYDIKEQREWLQKENRYEEAELVDLMYKLFLKSKVNNTSLHYAIGLLYLAFRLNVVTEITLALQEIIEKARLEQQNDNT